MKKVLVIAVCALAVQLSATVKVGFSTRDITPAPGDLAKGVKLWGWGGPATVAQKKEDNIFVRTAAIRDKNNKLLVIVTVDTGKFHAVDSILLREWFERKFKTGRWNLVLNSSHTHQSPDWYYIRGAYPVKFREMLIRAIKESVSEAVAKAATPVIVKFARLKIPENMIYNKNGSYFAGRGRRHPKEKQWPKLAKEFSSLDTDLPVFSFHDAKNGRIKGFLWSFAAHPTYTVIPAAEHRIRLGANAPGAVSRALKRHFGGGVSTLFAQGAAGDLKIKLPELAGAKWKYNRKFKHGEMWLKGKKISHQQYYKALDSYGDRIAAIIQQGFKDKKFRKIDVDIKVAGKIIEIPQMPGVIPKKSKLGIRTQYLRKPKHPAAYYKKQLAAAGTKQKYSAREALFVMNNGEKLVYRIFIERIQLNKDLQIVAMSGEVCHEIGLMVKKYYKPVTTVFWGYTNCGSPYYPTDRLHKVGTYQGSFMWPEKGISFEKTVLDAVKKLEPK